MQLPASGHALKQPWGSLQLSLVNTPSPPTPRPSAVLPALTYHYETQCIPTPAAWYAHQLPVWFQKFSVVATYVIEIAVPLLFFMPIRRLRLFAFYCQVCGDAVWPSAGCPSGSVDAPNSICARAQVLLQILIILTGNYNFFNALTIVLAFSLLDEEHVGRWMGRGKRKHGSCESLGSCTVWGLQSPLQCLEWGGDGPPSLSDPGRCCSGAVGSELCLSCT